MSSLLNDFRYAGRQLRKAPGFTVTVVLTLALGIGATTAIFTLVHAILLRSLPVGNPAQLYRVGDLDACCVQGGFINDNGDFDIFSYALYQHLRGAAPEFEQLAAVQAGLNSMTVRRGGAAAKESGSEYVSGNYFSTLGVRAFAGRMFSPADDKAGAPLTAVLSYQAWQADYAGDLSVIGSTFHIQSQPVTIVGIAPPGFYGDRIRSNPPVFWIPLAAEPVIAQASSNLHDPDRNWLYAVGRLKPGVAILPLQKKLSAALRQWLATVPAYTENGGTSLIPKQHVVLTPAGGGIQSLQQNMSSGLRLLMVLSVLVLLIACANIANLLLVRGNARRAELSIRMALGAARVRLVRQMLTESVLLGCIGGLAGLAVAYAGSRAILAFYFPDAVNMPMKASPSLAVLGFAFGLALLTGIVFGIAPAWIASHSEPAEALRGMSQGSGSGRDRSALPQKSLVVFQAALSLVLLAGAGLLIQSLRNLEHQNFGIATTNRYVVGLDPAGAGYTPEKLSALYRELEQRFSALPSVQSMGLALYSPLGGDNWGDGVFIEGRPTPSQGDDYGASWDRVSPDFFKTVGQPVIRGRGITEQDTATSRFVAVVNRAFVKKFFPKEDPIGRHFGTTDQQYANSFEIVGVVADAKYTDPLDPVRPMFFRPLTQQITNYKDPSANSGETQSMFIHSMVLHFKAPQQDAEALVRRTLASVDPNLAVEDMHSLDYQVAGNFNEERLITRLTGLFGLLALILASVGLYGVTAYSVGRRTHEIGLRMALGAPRSSVVRMVMRVALWQVVLGLAIGIPATLLCGRLIASDLYGVGAYDPVALAVAALVLFACAAVAGYIPARRAAGIDPMRALRQE